MNHARRVFLATTRTHATDGFSLPSRRSTITDWSQPVPTISGSSSNSRTNYHTDVRLPTSIEGRWSASRNDLANTYMCEQDSSCGYYTIQLNSYKHALKSSMKLHSKFVTCGADRSVVGSSNKMIYIRTRGHRSNFDSLQRNGRKFKSLLKTFTVVRFLFGRHLIWELLQWLNN